MPDREKVIKGLECCTFILGKRKCNECPYQKENGCYQLQDDFHALLKEQEPVEPKIQTSHDGNGTWWYVCGMCNTAINPNDKFCHECGKKVKLG